MSDELDRAATILASLQTLGAIEVVDSRHARDPHFLEHVQRNMAINLGAKLGEKLAVSENFVPVERPSPFDAGWSLEYRVEAVFMTREQLSTLIGIVRMAMKSRDLQKTEIAS